MVGVADRVGCGDRPEVGVAVSLGGEALSLGEAVGCWAGESVADAPGVKVADTEAEGGDQDGEIETASVGVVVTPADAVSLAAGVPVVLPTSVGLGERLAVGETDAVPGTETVPVGGSEWDAVVVWGAVGVGVAVWRAEGTLLRVSVRVAVGASQAVGVRLKVVVGWAVGVVVQERL